MNMLRKLAAAAAFSMLAIAAMPAQAANVVLCSPVSDANGPRRVVNPNTTTAYTLNGVGCALIASADVGYFLSQGFAVDGPYRSMVVSGQTSAFSLTLPAGAYIQSVILQETSGAAVTGGVKIGTTSGGTDVVAAIVMPASSLAMTSDASFGAAQKRAFSATVPQTLFFGAVSSFNGAALNATVVYTYF